MAVIDLWPELEKDSKAIVDAEVVTIDVACPGSQYGAAVAEARTNLGLQDTYCIGLSESAHRGLAVQNIGGDLGRAAILSA